MARNVIIKDKLYKVGDLLMVKNTFRIYDIVKIEDILFNINTERFVFYVKPITFSDYYYVTHDDIIGLVDIIEGVELNDKRK